MRTLLYLLSTTECHSVQRFRAVCLEWRLLRVLLSAWAAACAGTGQRVFGSAAVLQVLQSTVRDHATCRQLECPACVDLFGC